MRWDKVSNFVKSGNEELDNKDSVAEIRDEPTQKVSYDSLSSRLLDKEDIMTKMSKVVKKLMYALSTWSIFGKAVCTVMLIKDNVSGGETMPLGSQDALTEEANTIKDQELR